MVSAPDNSAQPMFLRPMQMTDLEKVMQIEPRIHAFPWSRGNFVDSLNAGYSCWVGIVGNAQSTTLMAYAVMMPVLDEAQILNISVAQGFQRQGYGRQLMQHLCKTAQSHRASHMFLEVRVSNSKAIQLYQQCGFNEMGIRPNYYPAHQGREDALLMGKVLVADPDQTADQSSSSSPEQEARHVI